MATNLRLRSPRVPKDDARRRDPRFRQLLEKALEGHEYSVHDLWAEYHFDYAKQGGRHA